MPLNELNQVILEERRSDDHEAHRIIHDVLVTVKQDISEVKTTLINIDNNLKVVDTAFIKNDLGNVDYDGHRKDHLHIEKSKKIMDNYKYDTAKMIIAVIVAFAIGLLADGFTNFLGHAARATGVG